MQVLGLGGAEPRLLAAVAEGLTRELRAPCGVSDARLDVSFAFHNERNQYHSSEIIAQLDPVRLEGAQRSSAGADAILIGVTDVDLYIPILTFVFGEAQLGGRCAVVSYHRLSQEFYGLPADDALRTERLVKEAVHEAGHVLGLTHCDDFQCVMAASHAVEWLDLKNASLCVECRNTLL